MADASKRARRQQVAAAAFAARRGDLGLTQEDVAQRTRRGSSRGVSVRTVINFESQGIYPNATSRARLERAVQWPSGEIARLAAEPEPEISPTLQRELDQLTRAQRAALLRWLGRELGTDPLLPAEDQQEGLPSEPGIDDRPRRNGG